MFGKSFRYIKGKMLDGQTGNHREVTIQKSDVEKLATDDPNMISFEVYNKGKSKIWFEENLLPQHGGMNRRIDCAPDSFCFLPHNYFIAFSEDDKPITIVKNFGDQKFIGKKTGLKIQK